MKADAIKKLTAELKIHNMQSRNKIIYTTAAVLFWWRRLTATANTALTSYLDLLGVDKKCSLMN